MRYAGNIPNDKQLAYLNKIAMSNQEPFQDVWKADQQEREDNYKLHAVNEPLLEQELDKVIDFTPLPYTVFDKEFVEQTVCYKGPSFNYQNTLYAYTMSYVVLACFGGFIVEYKYKDRHHLDDQKYIKMWSDLFNEWWNKGLVMPVVMAGGVIKNDLCLIDKERGQWVTLLPDGKVKVGNENVASMLLDKDAVNEHNRNAHHDEGFENGIPKGDWSAQDNLKHQYTEEEIGELTMRTCYSLYCFPSHELNQKNLSLRPYSLIHYKMMNEATGTELFVKEGQLPTVVYQLEVPGQGGETL